MRNLALHCLMAAGLSALLSLGLAATMHLPDGSCSSRLQPAMYVR